MNRAVRGDQTGQLSDRERPQKVKSSGPATPP